MEPKPILISVHGVDIILTPETILEARKQFQDNCKSCIDSATSGELFVNDLKGHNDWQNLMIEESKNGKYDKTLSFIQRAYFIQSGKCVPILPKY